MKADSKSQPDSAPIADFNGHYQFLNNDHPAWVALDDQIYPSVSIAYQAARTDNVAIRQALSEVDTYEKFKELSLTIPNPPDWATRKHRVMEKLVRDKFKRNKQLGSKLAATNPRGLVNSYKQGGQNEQCWGIVEGKGGNALGKILMKIREQIIKGGDWDKWINDQGVESNEKMRPTVALTVIREDKPIDKLFLEKKGKFFFGSHHGNDFKLDNQSISKAHACIYFGFDLNLLLIDLGSSNGTTLIRNGQSFKLEHFKAVSLENNDIIMFGKSTRKYKVEIDCKAVEEYMKEQQAKVEEEIKHIKQNPRPSRSRSRSPKHRKSRN